MSIQNETLVNLFTDLGIPTDHTSKSLTQLASTESRFIKDLKLNVTSVLGSTNLGKKDAVLLALSVSINEKCDVLTSAFEGLARKEGASEAEISETHACTGVMVTNNVFYRFRHYMDGIEYYNNQPAGIRMSIMMNPVMGKELFELMSLAVSAVNGCQRCVTSHENSVKQHGASEARIYDAIRLAAVIKSFCAMM